MGEQVSASSTGPRYAPPDPTLPKPWRGLVDGKTGYLYFWNPETNVTQYEKPTASSGRPALEKPAATVQLSSSIEVNQSSHGHQQCGGIDNKVESNEVVSTERNNQGSNASTLRLFTKAPGSNVGGVSSVDSYCRQHEITVMGDNTPPPLISFESTDFPSEILREVRCLLLEELMSYTVPPSFVGLQIIGASLFGGPIFLRIMIGITKFVTRAAASVGSLCHSEQKASVSPASACSVRQAGFTAPTPIQAQSWPIALQNRDIVAVAKTGSGKTLGYLIPGFIHLKRRRNNSKMGPTVLVLSPTRELATQIQDEAVKFGRSSRISCTCLYGGAQKGPQLKELERGADIVVATPGRLNDILEMKRISLHQVSYLVLDEADRMLDMGFEPQIRKIVKEIPSSRQTLMYTATWPKEVRKIAADLLVNPVQVNIGNINELVANKSITQHVEVVSYMEKNKRLEQILRSQEPGSKVIVFCSTKKMCDRLAGNMAQQFGAAAIHGDKSQSEREHVLNQFRTGKSPVLVATDVAARGLDIKDIRVVINYDFPTGIEDYVHRIGRTGRAGATGVAYSFFSDQDAKHATDLIKVLEGANQRVPVEIRAIASRGGGMGNTHRRWSSSGSGYSDGQRQPRWSESASGESSSQGFHMSSYKSRGDIGGGSGYSRSYHEGQNEDSHDSYNAGGHSWSSQFSTGGISGPNRGDGGSNHQSRSRSRSRSRSPKEDQKRSWHSSQLRERSYCGGDGFA